MNKRTQIFIGIAVLCTLAAIGPSLQVWGEEKSVCDVLHEYVDAVPNGFRNILGAYDKSVDEHHTLHILPGAAKCIVDFPGESIAGLSCTFYFESAEKREASFHEIQHQVELCFPGKVKVIGKTQPTMYVSGARLNLLYQGEFDGKLTIEKE